MITNGSLIETTTNQVTLNGAGLSSLGLTLSYKWTARNSTATVSSPNSATTNVILGGGAGDYTFVLIVTDSRGAQSNPASIRVRYKP